MRIKDINVEIGIEIYGENKTVLSSNHHTTLGRVRRAQFRKKIDLKRPGIDRSIRGERAPPPPRAPYVIALFD
ncbi:hypothetical protein GWI33_019413 [Rhynchophorus ferrugineus]|uniref:Uncharacterized protein n=1 Tax=Rhynchophorus ferrugineus TaxID=354439 RepID=A0A834HYC4_RHYFE|nr:hypothetical protein GWI33_019413 [Rhynchophorus ferrugineus]